MCRADGHGQCCSEIQRVVPGVDDMKDWVNCLGGSEGTVHTPNIDRLAKRGMLFTNAHCPSPKCAPSRAAILTGKYPARLLLTQWLPSGRWSRTKHKMREGRYISNLPLEEFTIAEATREAGYRSAFMGKWHLGTETYYYSEHQGFDINVAGRGYGAPEVTSIPSREVGRFRRPARRFAKNHRCPERRATTLSIAWPRKAKSLFVKMRISLSS